MNADISINHLYDVFIKLLNYIKKHPELFLISGLIMLAVVQYAVRPQSQSYDQIIRSGELRVLISDEPDAQYLFGKNHYGFEYEMLAKFADHLGVTLKLDVVPFGELFNLLESGAGDIAVGGILETTFVKKVTTPSIPWFKAQTTIVYKRGETPPQDIDNIEKIPVLTSARYYGVEHYESYKLTDDYRSEYELLNAVATGAERFALSTNYRAKNARHYLPELNRSALLPQHVDIVWALPRRADQKLLGELNGFLTSVIKEDIPNKLAKQYLSLPNRLSTYDALSIHKKIKTTFPIYEYIFRKAARRGGIDWQLLAAMAYQESRWSNEARSPTGVRGIMQMTTETAEFLGVTDRMDMNQSIIAAGDYILFLKSKIPKLVKEPERTWFAVGAYNMGLKHILNAYKKARSQGIDRTTWRSVSSLLPTLYGYPMSQGNQAIQYVERIQIYTDILRFYDLHQRDDVLFDRNKFAVKVVENKDKSIN